MAIIGYDWLFALRDQLFEQGTYDARAFQAAAYELRIGRRELLFGGKYYEEFTDSLIELPPHQIAFLSTEEIVHLPYNIAGQVTLRFEYARKGLLMLFAGHVDPLYTGHLYLVVYNLTDKPIPIKQGVRIARIQFQEVHYLSQDNDKLKHDLDGFRIGFESLPHDIVYEWKERHLPQVYDRLQEHTTQLSNLQQQLDSVTATSQYVIVGGLVLLATTLLGVVLGTVFSAWNSALNLSSFASASGAPWLMAVLLLVPVLTVALFMGFIGLILRQVAKRRV